MCRICFSNPCRDGCPNQIVRPVDLCEQCGCGIYGGQEYVEGVNGKYHYHCLRDMYTEDILNALGVEMHTAWEEEDDVFV